MSNEQLLLAAIGALTGCVGHLYYRMDGLHKQCETEKKQCEENNKKLWERLAHLEDTQG